MTDERPIYSDDERRRLARLVESWRRPLLLSHTRADGDALGSLVALRSVLRSTGAQPTALLFEAPQQRYTWLVDSDPIEVFAPDVHPGPTPALDQADAVVLLDTCARAQIEPLADWLRACPLPKLAVDHHVTRDDVADDYLVDETACATALIICDWAQSAGWSLDARARLALYVGLATDTGWFRFANTDARTLSAAARLVAGGVSPADVFERIYQGEPAGRVRLLAEVLNTLELHHGGRLAVMSATRAAFARAGADPAHTEDLVNYPLQIATVDVSVLLVEQDGGTTRASFRSKAPSNARPDIDVAALAAEFDGGGHRRAAATRVNAPLATVKRLVIDRLGRHLPKV